jgi:hypothetical protein
VHLPGKHRALSLNPRTTKNNYGEKKKKAGIMEQQV